MAKKNLEYEESILELEDDASLKVKAVTSTNPLSPVVSYDQAVAYWASGRTTDEAAQLMIEHSRVERDKRIYFLPPTPTVKSGLPPVME